MKPFKVAYGRKTAMTLDAVLPITAGEDSVDVAIYLKHAEGPTQLTRLRIKYQHTTDSHRYNLLRRYVEYQPGDHVSAVTVPKI